MSISRMASQSENQLHQIGKLFAEKPPLLIEVRFPKMGTSSDWYLCEDSESFEGILDRLASGAELHISSVWDIREPAGSLVFNK